RRGGEDPVRGRLRRQGVGRVARRPGARRRAGDAEPCGSPGETCYPCSLASRGGTVSHLLTTGLGGSRELAQPSRLTRRCRCMPAVLSFSREVNTSLVKDI